MSADREIAVFWHFESVGLPSWADPAAASKAIFNAVSSHGRIVDRRLYYDFSSAEGASLWSTIDSSGFDLVVSSRVSYQAILLFCLLPVLIMATVSSPFRIPLKGVEKKPWTRSLSLTL
jgi:hypothetical protein